MKANETWGISGPGFLLLYGLLGISAFAISLCLRNVFTWRVIRAQQTPAALTAPETGMLFSDDRAVATALAELRAASALAPDGRAAGDPGPVSTFAKAIHTGMAATGLTRVWGVTNAAAEPLATMRTDLINRGFLTGRDYRLAVARSVLLPALLLPIGMLRLIWGAIIHKPVAGLALEMTAIAIGAVASLWTNRRTHLGRLHAYAAQHQLHPQVHPPSPAWTVATAGPTAMWGIDPEFAHTNGFQPPAARSSGSGADGGGGCGGSSCGGGCGGGGGGGGCGGGG